MAVLPGLLRIRALLLHDFRANLQLMEHLLHDDCELNSTSTVASQPYCTISIRKSVSMRNAAVSSRTCLNWTCSRFSRSGSLVTYDFNSTELTRCCRFDISLEQLSFLSLPCMNANSSLVDRNRRSFHRLRLLHRCSRSIALDYSRSFCILHHVRVDFFRC